jgi:energy-coupling factor transporter ATP-binding protein EcfA2
MHGTDVIAGIEDESNHYELSQRSDGFKRFVTFLLMVSAEEATNLLKDILLLIDEPEIGLHPTGARYLMDELIDIAKNNYVVFSTHSIFMIDSKIINRHLIVKKEGEITDVEEASDSNIQDEEVIYKSLGYSIFMNLKQKNLIFEGWRDKRLFEVALSRVPAEYQDIKRLKDLGHCFAHGVKQIKNITPLFQAGARKCLILSDSDTTAKEHQREYQKSKGFGLWKTYDDIVDGAVEITGEDFIKHSAFRTPIAEVAAERDIPELPIGDLEGANARMGILRRWLVNSNVEQQAISGLLENIKDKIFTDLKPSEIRPEYYTYLLAVALAVDQM